MKNEDQKMTAGIQPQLMYTMPKISEIRAKICRAIQVQTNTSAFLEKGFCHVFEESNYFLCARNLLPIAALICGMTG